MEPTKKKLPRILMMLALLIAAAVMAAAVTTSQLGDMERLDTLALGNYVQPLSTNYVGPANARGGTLMKAGSTAYAHYIWTSSIANAPYATKLQVLTSATLTCSSLTVTGMSSLGKAATQTLTSISTTPQVTALAYSRLDRVSASGCLGSSGYVLVLMSKHAGLPVPIRSVTNLHSLCRAAHVYTSTGGPSVIQAQCALRSTLDAITFDSAANTIDIESTGTNVVRGDEVIVRMKAPTY